MSVVIETTIGDITVDLFLEERPRACLNFLKLCKLKYYNFNLFFNIERNFIAQTGDASGAGDGGQSIWGIIEGPHKRFFEAESLPKIKHEVPGLLSMVSIGKNMVSSQFFFTLGEDLISLDNIHCVIGEVVEGHEILRKLNEAIVDEKYRPYQDIRITHTVVLEDPFDDPRGFRMPSRSPSPSAERMKNGRIAADEEINDTEGKTTEEIQEMLAEREAKARATILEIVGDLPDAEVAPPENVLFVCKLNPVTTEDDLEIIFSRFGRVIGCEVIRDKMSGDSLQYAFVEFEDKKACEAAYFKMDNVLIDDRRIHVDFSQSVAKVQWRGKGRGLIHKDGKEDRKLDFNNYKNKDIERKKSDMENQNKRRNYRRSSSRSYDPPHSSRLKVRSRSRSRELLQSSRSGKGSSSRDYDRPHSSRPKNRSRSRSYERLHSSSLKQRSRSRNGDYRYSSKRRDKSKSPNSKKMRKPSEGDHRQSSEKRSMDYNTKSRYDTMGSSARHAEYDNQHRSREDFRKPYTDRSDKRGNTLSKKNDSKRNDKSKKSDRNKSKKYKKKKSNKRRRYSSNSDSTSSSSDSESDSIKKKHKKQRRRKSSSSSSSTS